MLLSEMITALQAFDAETAAGEEASDLSLMSPFTRSLHQGNLSPEASWAQVRRNPLQRESFERLIGKADRYRSAPPASLPFTAFRLFDATGNRMTYETEYFAHRDRLNTFALLSLSGDASALPDLEDAIWAICDEYTWCLPAHLGGCSLDPARLAGKTPLSTEAPGYRPHDQEVDLFAAETAFALSEICALLGDRLSPIVAARARHQVSARVLGPASGPGPAWIWETTTNNWAAVCAGSVGIAAMYLVKDARTLAPILLRMMQAMESFLAGFEADGACTEGLTYWNYGFGFYAAFSERLFARTGGRVDLMTGQKVREIALFQQRAWMGGACVISFSDGSRTGRWHPGLTHWLRRRFPEVKVPDERYMHLFGDDPCHRWNWDLRNFIWSDAPEPAPSEEASAETTTAGKVKQDLFALRAAAARANAAARDNAVASKGSALASEPFPGVTDDIRVPSVSDPSAAARQPTDSIWFADASWLISKVPGQFGPVVFAAKGGHNDEPHNHNDLGSFLLHAGGETFLDDVGAGEYTKEYFGPERYACLVNGSHGHSVPIFGWTGQSAGRQYQADVILSETGPEQDVLALDLTRAYELPALRSFTRTFLWEKTGIPSLSVEDHIVAEESGLPITERFVTCMEPARTEAGILLQGKAGSLLITSDTEGFAPVISSESFANHDGKQEILWKVDFTSGLPMQECRFKAVFSFMNATEQLLQ